MRIKERTKEILDLLDENYGTTFTCYLDHESPVQLLIATMLSAQCTDARVNIVTKSLFEKYKTVEEFAQADIYELEEEIHSTGFYHNKAKNIIACTKELVSKYQSQVPRDIEELTSLAGVGRKTANVIRGNIFHVPSVVVDTHVLRISKKLGLTKEVDAVKVEYVLMKILPKERWILYNIHIIRLGREICTARSPKCEICFLKEHCPTFSLKDSSKVPKTIKASKVIKEAKIVKA